MGMYFARDVLEWAGVNIILCLLVALWWIPAHRYKQPDSES